MTRSGSAAAPSSDAELARAAAAGDSAAFGLLFQRYRPRLHATALRIVGYGAAAEDAVSDAFLIALTRLSQLRNPDAVGGWLHAVVRNCCLMELRRRPPPGEPPEDELEALSDEACIEHRIQRRELREWIWSALDQLPETQRVTVMLRYFGSYQSYDELAAILAVPVGTVRSRLSDAKTRLADLLLRSAAREGSAVAADDRRPVLARVWNELYNGRRDAFLAHYSTDLQLVFNNGPVKRGRIHFDRIIDEDLRVGVRVDIQRMLTSGDVTVLEGIFVNPPEDPQHCPPGAALVHFHENERTVRLHIHHAARPPLAD